MTRWFYLSVALAALVAAGSLYAGVFHSDRLPEQLPVHWNVEGEPDGWIAIGTALVLWPAVAAGSSF